MNIFISIRLAVILLGTISCLHAQIEHNHHKKTEENSASSFPKTWSDPNIKRSQIPRLMGKQMGSVDTIGVLPLGYERDGEIKVFHLIAQPVEKILVDTTIDLWKDLIPREYRVNYQEHSHPIKQIIRCWGFNGSMPGPTIEINEGDRVRIIVKNELPEPTSIHWHGIEVPNNQDGAGGITQKPIMPGQTFTYEFTVYQSGTYLYHTGFNMVKQEHLGLTGMFVIHPKNPEHTINKDIAILLQEWAILPGSMYPNVMTMDFNWATMNGLAAPNIPPIIVKQGERVRLRFGNLSMNSHPIHIHGYTWEEVGTEGGPIKPSARRKGATINVPPGSTRDVEFVAWNPGVWRLHCHKMHHIMNAHAQVPMGIMPIGGMFTVINVIPTKPDAHWKHPQQKEKKLSTNDRARILQ